ncbi:hypothetical protein Pint_09955 [Pistacia integerrima]|uniref:Uncharacterized protein n=1 Tax=Pistacia integerrima TaxID=434235 RepID=A0ACC0XHN3_9ROSI|nr:hypothetical protein Pint_09955 [Pistacia integerrima]
MNSISVSNGENSEKHTSPYSCLYCKKVFPNHRALGGHLKTHTTEFKSRWRRQPPGHSGISIGFPSTNPNPLSNNQSGNSSGGAGNNSSCSNKVIPMHASKFSESSPKKIKTLFILSPNLSSGCGLNEIHLLNCLPSTAFAPSGSTAATGVPLDPSLCLGMPGVRQFGTGDDRTPRDGLDLNQSPGFKDTSAVGSFIMDPYPCLGHDEGCRNKMKNLFTCEEGKRQYSVDSLGNTDLVKSSKRPKIVSNLPVETEKFQNKEPLLFKDVEKPFTALGISINAEPEVPADLDLSLHL